VLYSATFHSFPRLTATSPPPPTPTAFPIPLLFAEGKTDYQARRALVVQDKNKYSAPKFRLVVRLTNRYVVAQVVHTELAGDKVLASAYSSELPRYGLKVGLKNYASAYATGLLIARRVLAQLKLADKYKGNTTVDGKVIKTTVKGEGGASREFFVGKVAEDRRPFRVFLDVGIRATTTGARVFAVMKGAADGGLDIPHNEKRFPGYNRDSKEFNAEELKGRIFGEHVKEYQETIREDDNEEYERRFSKYVGAGLEPDDIPALYASVHSAIRKDPSPAAKKPFKADKKFRKPSRLNAAARKTRVAAKKSARLTELKSRMAEDDE
jgi:large subunit ribosomal protein L5e